MSPIRPACTHHVLLHLVCRVLAWLGLGLLCLALNTAGGNIAAHSVMRLPVAAVFFPSENLECTVPAFVRDGKVAVYEDRFTGPGFLKIGVQYPVKRLKPVPGGKVWRFGLFSAVSSDGRFLATTFRRTKNGGCGLCLWSLATRRPLWVERDAEPWTRFGVGSPIAFSLANRYLAYFAKSDGIVVRVSGTGARHATLNFPKGIAPGNSSQRIAFAANGRIISVTQFHIVCWDIATEKVAWVLPPPTGLSGFSGFRVAVIRNGKELAVAAYPAGKLAVIRKWAPEIALYDVKTGKALGAISVPAVVGRGARRAGNFSLLTDIAASQDGRYLVVAENGEGPFPRGVAQVGRLVVVGLAGHRIIYASGLRQGGLWSVAISPDDSFVLASEPTRLLLFRMPWRL